MSKVDIRISKEVTDLVESGLKFNQSVSTSTSGIKGEELAEISAWVTRLGHLIRKLYGEKSQYFVSYSAALDVESFYSLHNHYHKHFTQMLGIARAINHDLSIGLLSDIRLLAQADVFADFLEMGEHLLEEGYKDAAAVIIGTVLEDGLRKLSERHSLSLTNDLGRALTIEPLNSQLAKNEIYSKLVQKQITSWAHVRNKAAHGEYEEYTKEQVQMMLLFVQGFSADHLK